MSSMNMANHTLTIRHAESPRALGLFSKIGVLFMSLFAAMTTRHDGPRDSYMAY
jgi:hypothetical protein